MMWIYGVDRVRFNLVFSGMGAAYGTAKSGVGVASMGVMRPELVMKSIVPVVMAGVLGIYGLIIAVIISTGINPKAKSYYLFDGYAHLSSGLACGLAGLSAGMAIGIVGDAGVRYICFTPFIMFVWLHDFLGGSCLITNVPTPKSQVMILVVLILICINIWIWVVVILSGF
jgi:V-type H+-transporting ATPase proteolipid subunit